MFPLICAIFAMVVIAVGVLFVSASQAQGSDPEDTTTLGIGSEQAHQDGSAVTAEERASGTDDGSVSGVSETVGLAKSAQRSITVKDPDPVVVPVAVDDTNPLAVQKANEVCTLDPLPTAPRVVPDVHDGTWSSGVASAYDITTNDDGFGNFGVATTASGIDLTHASITVAVPAEKSYLVGSVVEVCYDGKVVIASVTDTGGFAQYGRALDLAPGVYQAFGASSYSEWGVRTVYYRFL